MFLGLKNRKKRNVPNKNLLLIKRKLVFKCFHYFLHFALYEAARGFYFKMRLHKDKTQAKTHKGFKLWCRAACAHQRRRATRANAVSMRNYHCNSLAMCLYPERRRALVSLRTKVIRAEKRRRRRKWKYVYGNNLAATRAKYENAKTVKYITCAGT